VRIGEGEREKWVERGQRGEGCVLMLLVMTEVKLMSAENGGNMFFRLDCETPTRSLR
jgi:hypothetical protein